MTQANDTDTPMAVTRLSRRAMLRGVAAVGASGALGALLAACGGSSTTATNTAAAPAATKPASAATQPTAAAASSVTGSAPTAAAASSAAVAATSVPAATPAAAVSPAAAAGAVKKGGTLKAGLSGSDILSLDPLTSGAIIDREIYYNIYDSLVAIDVNAQIIPALAEKWETPDPKTYILHLRQGVKFHDGTDFNGDAVKFNMMRYLTDPKSLRKAEIDTISSVDVMDPYTVKFTLKSAFAPLLATLVDRAGMMLSPTAVQTLGPDGVVQKPIGAGTGAFKFVEWVKNDHITVTRNPNYWKKDASGTQLPYLDQITYRPIADATVLLTNAQTGDLDAMYTIAGKDVAAVKSSNALVFKDAPGIGFSSFQFNAAKEPFNKKEFRQAFAEALDRDQILKTVNFGAGQAGQGPIQPSSWAYDPTFKPYGGNVDKAKQYLAAGGSPGGFSCELLIASGSPTTTQLAQLVKDQLAKVGIIVTIKQEEGATQSADQMSGNFQIVPFGWSGRIDPDGNIYNNFHTGAGLNYGKYSNPQADALMEQARAAGDQAQRKDLYQQVQKLIVDDAPHAFYYFSPNYLITQPKVQGMQLYPDYMMRFDVASLK
jgi:peptide/nickel transport system substrate-binding protein